MEAIGARAEGRNPRLAAGAGAGAVDDLELLTRLHDAGIPQDFDRERHPPELLAYFLDHAEDWRNGRIRLGDHCERFTTGENGELVAQWYPDSLDSRVLVDKAELFERLGYRPALPSCFAHASLQRIRTLSGGARYGKSRWAGFEILPLLLTPGFIIWIVAPDYSLGEKEFRYALEAINSTVIRDDFGEMIDAGRVRNNAKGGDMEIRLDWGDAGFSQLIVKSARNKESLLGEAVDAVILAEASQLTAEIWSRYLQPRLMNTDGIALFPSSPQGTDWFDTIAKKGLDGTRGFFTVNADTRMNPTLKLGTVVDLSSRDQMGDSDFAEQIRGIGVPKHGLIYLGFSRALHVDTWDVEWPRPSWRRGRVFDFGFRDAYVVLWFARDEDGRFYFYREFYKRGVLTDEVVAAIAKAEGWPTSKDAATGKVTLVGAPRVEKMSLTSICDWDAGERESLRRRGIGSRMANKSIDEGVKSVARSLQLQRDGKPRVYISPRCLNLIREVRSYEWGPHGGPKANQDDHAMDAMRYAIHTLDPRYGELKIREIEFG